MSDQGLASGDRIPLGGVKVLKSFEMIFLSFFSDRIGMTMRQFLQHYKSFGHARILNTF